MNEEIYFEYFLTLTTEFGLYLAKKWVNKAEVSLRKGISKSRMGQLTLNTTTKF